jgi:hypothetical protein
MDSATIMELLEAAGYTLGHAHVSGAPEGQPDTVLVVHQNKDQTPPCSGLIDHLESEEPDQYVGNVVASIERRMARFKVQHAPDGAVIWIFLDIPVECPELKEARDEAALVSAINSNGSRALN